ncbi:MAG TPA: AgmX/PglI C-terminal domain-containing protein [Kofleriaceae bacterium]|nr:AgmX/PglI C-terminal domain-containing protein [Kofleriaceae bacterium]
MKTLLAVALACAACGKPDDPDPPPPAPEPEPTVPIAFADCAGPTTRWISGPRPQAFDRADADKAGSGAHGWAFATMLGDSSAVPPAPPAAPAVRTPHVIAGGLASAGDLDKTEIRRVVHRHVGQIELCYSEALARDPTLAGEVEETFFIGPKGDVVTSEASGVDMKLATCIAGVIRTLTFPAPRGGGGVQVHYPIKLRPAGRDADGEDESADDAPAAPEPAPPPDQASAPPGAAHDDYGAQVEAAYTPGGDNPLRAQRDALAHCLARGPVHAGIAVIELHYAAAGTTGKVFGIDDDATAACIVAAAQRVTHKGVDAERCGLTFGTMPLSAMPTIDIAEDAVRLAGDQIGSVRALDDDPDAIGGISAALAARLADSPAAPLALRGPLVIRPIDATPMKVLRRVYGAVLDAHDDFVLAAQRGGQWQLLRPMTFPVPPVPLGTGGRFAPVNGTQPRGAPAIELRILITTQQVFVSSSDGTINAVQNRSDDGWKEAADAVKTARANPVLATSKLVVVAPGDDVTYGDTLRAIDLAASHGFTDFVLDEPDQRGRRGGY